MKRIYTINGWEESRAYFLNILGTATHDEIKILLDGGTVERNGNELQILNPQGI
jgi:hypothetical protein